MANPPTRKCPKDKDGAKKKQTPKPIMRDMHLNQSLRNVYAAVTVSLLASLSFYFLHNRRRRNIYKEFYANYDAEASFQRMMERGVLSSCSPPSPEDTKKK